MSMKAVHVLCLITVLLSSCMLFVSQDAKANVPEGVELSYEMDSQTLTVTISHPVDNPTAHYIKCVEIKKNSKTVSINNYTEQPSMSSFRYTYNVDAGAADILEATATCNFAGSKTGQVRARPLPTILIQTPEEGTTIYNSQTTVSGMATGDLSSGKVQLSVNGGPWFEAIGTDPWGLQVSLDEGSNNITARVTDSNGNTAEDKVIIMSNPPDPPRPYIVVEDDTPGFEALLVILGAVLIVLAIRLNRGNP